MAWAWGSTPQQLATATGDEWLAMLDQLRLVTEHRRREG